MKINKIKIENFRLLKNFQLDLENELSLVIGKNNCGKTSLLAVLDKFLNQSDKTKFSFDDFNIDFKNEIKALVENPSENDDIFEQKGIKLKLFIEYNEEDNLSNVSRVMMDLDPNNNFIVLGFEYVLDFEKLNKLRIDYNEFAKKEALKIRKKKDDESKSLKDLFYFLKANHQEYFVFARKSIEFDLSTNEENELNFIDLIKEKISIKEIINFKFIRAKRDVSNKEADKTLSIQTSKIYTKTEASDEQQEAIDDFKDKLSDTDFVLSDIYSNLFKNVIEKVKIFGGVKKDDSIIEIVSTLQHRELLEGNTTVMYNHNESSLPEHYNGLGYMNLISMIFEIEILIQDFKNSKDEKPSDINLLFIEEPEAHTHPQMQYVFIKNIKELLKQGIKRDDGQSGELQSIISTHSSHIVSESNFDDIKYLKKNGNNSVIAKNLKELKEEYKTNTKQYEFLKQYLTINRAEIFFADKAILIEGDTERILFPTLMKKYDIEEEKKHKSLGTVDNSLPLLSQNISIIEVGAYSQIFEKFIEFIGIKTLVITDLDTIGLDDKKCEPSIGVNYSNDALSFFFNNPTLIDLKGFTIQNKTFSNTTGLWNVDGNGKLCVVYQILENGFNSRSFEDSFIHLNRDFITPIKNEFKGLKNRTDFDNTANNAYQLAENCINKKTHFALDILYHSNDDFSNWQIPGYIKEGLLWLKQD
ncbi:ATP-dependent endonuclease [Flavobacterium ranwuense]|uniref:ATP-dependent endonuclease n=2 Tax=Flavobacterium TaxID=237 RepID=A0ABY2DRB0_9FLAO|nr:ATP-dependent endonuclease [Flavobacterium ranwuense]TDE29306.1 ATP-dependent endonuclease [Flavobacterium ranwuense]